MSASSSDDFTTRQEAQEFSIENAFGMHARSAAWLPAAGIYDKTAWASQVDIIERCHIYFIGFTEQVRLETARAEGAAITLFYSVSGTEYPLRWDLPEGHSLKMENNKWFIEDPSGRRGWPSDVGAKLSKAGATTFDVRYIGQAYGTDGSRNAMDRLQKHETLQKISLLGTPEGYDLQLLLLEIEPASRLYTMMNPYARDRESNEERIQLGLDKLYNTSEEERISLYEASFIRYFSPQYNKEFKDSFPSTKLKILQDCYDKDFSAVVAEICMDKLPWRLKSDKVDPGYYHIAKHDLHLDEARRAFFGL